MLLGGVGRDLRAQIVPQVPMRLQVVWAGRVTGIGRIGMEVGLHFGLQVLGV